MIDCYLPPDTIVIEAPEPSTAEAALDMLLGPFQPLREQFTAITGLGLELDEAQSLKPRRRIQPQGRGAPILSFLSAGAPGGQRIIFLHGSPGLGEEWQEFLVETPDGQYRLAPDRPGFGESMSDGPVVSLSAQAAAIEPLLGHEGAIVVGYSYGGPVALRLAADYPDRVDGMLLIGAAADPALEEVHPLQDFAALEYFSLLLPDELAHANAELLALKSELEDLEGALDQINVPITLVQGLQDTLVPPENVPFIVAHLDEELKPRVILIEDGDHFLPWTHSELLEQALACVIADAKGQSAGPLSPDPE